MNTLKEELNFLSHPGETILETIEYYGLTVENLVAQTGLSLSTLVLLIDGKIEIDENIALKLEDSLSIPKDFWIEREKNYRKKVMEVYIKYKESMSVSDLYFKGGRLQEGDSVFAETRSKRMKQMKIKSISYTQSKINSRAFAECTMELTDRLLKQSTWPFTMLYIYNTPLNN